MAEKTKAVNLTEKEVKELIEHHGRYLSSDTDDRVERIKYLNSRLKTFNEVEQPKQVETAPASTVTGWGNPSV